MLTHLSPAFDKGCTVGFAILSGVAAMAVLTSCPEGILSFDTKLATQALSQATGALMRNKASTEAGKVLPHSLQNAYSAALCKQSVGFTLVRVCICGRSSRNLLYLFALLVGTVFAGAHCYDLLLLCVHQK